MSTSIIIGHLKGTGKQSGNYSVGVTETSADYGLA
jgi:hypothetical protein